jgi:PadR family transcriptional regulator PadR
LTEYPSETTEHLNKEAASPPVRFFHGMKIPRGILIPPLFIPSILLLLKEKPSHGYSLLIKLADAGVIDAEMDPSPIYKVLRLLEENGLAVSEYEIGNKGPARRVYRLTDKGNKTLSVMASRIERSTEIIRWFQDKYKESRQSAQEIKLSSRQP